MMFIIVDLPDPDGPIIATYSPRSTVRVIPRKAWTLMSPMKYVLWT